METLLSRSSFLRLTAASALFILPANARAGDDEITNDTIFNDPESPIAGNPKGDLTIVDFFDYNCPYCKKAAPDLERIVKADGNIKLIYKDWPILHETSIIGVRLAMGAKYQDKYFEVNHALMAIPGYGVSEEMMMAAVRKTSVDQSRLKDDMEKYAPQINGLVKRNLAIAEAIGFQGTPGFLVGQFKVNQALDHAGFVKVIADARARARNSKK